MKPNISVFYPTYNEAETISTLINQTIRVLKKVANKYEIIVVNDGSIDNTPRIVQELSKRNSKVRMVTHPVNLGYGAALRSGIQNSRYDLIFYTDSDLQFDVAELEKLLPLIKRADIVSAYRTNRQDPLTRKIVAWVYNKFLRYYLGVKVKDIDCAFKLYKKEIFNHITIRSEKGTADVEILAKAQKKGFKIAQVGVHHYKREKGDSVFDKNLFNIVSPSYVIILLQETYRVKQELKKM